MKNRMFFTNLKVFAINLILTKLSYQLSCLDEKGKPVDWFIVYKLPKLETSSIETVASGYGYVFITNKSIKSKNWTLSLKGIDEKDSIFGQTIGPIISNKKNSELSYVVYNDGSPDSSDSDTLAHSKGIFALRDEDGGFWLSHSVPEFPTLKKAYTYPKSGIKNGQTALCISLDAMDTISLNNIATNLLIMRPNIYGIKINDNLYQSAEMFAELDQKNWIKTETSIQTTIQSKKGVIFTGFSKSKEFEDDLYSGLIGPYFKNDFLVQSWRIGSGGKLNSQCKTKYKVQNINRIVIPIAEHSEWIYTEDHSKWAITSDTSDKSYTCIADINRVKSQYKRGGGSLCMDSKPVWKIFKVSIEEIEGCKSKKRSKTKKKSKKKTKQ